MFERKATDALLDIYYQALSDLSDDKFKEAISSVVRSKTFHKLPLPGEILDAISSDESEALLALQKAEYAISRHGSYSTVRFDDPVIHMVITAMGGWSRFCSPSTYGDDQEWHWKQKEFIQLYNTFLKNPRGNVPSQLSGICDTHNASNGHGDFQMPIMVIGDKNKALDKRAKVWFK